ncbi:hypothetical protein EW026_g5033 [Hermanssonia centrifuga]|uniref:Cyanovirin-N domain-containing protein n=1 Tax=Hermanssonia centrifuga TaxID=98765 RepID=A0A4S4KFC8_9APHY|nr:hypothetical protein EW026_g5033 [Hermanssonia centrifuga]
MLSSKSFILLAVALGTFSNVSNAVAVADVVERDLATRAAEGGAGATCSDWFISGSNLQALCTRADGVVAASVIAISTCVRNTNGQLNCGLGGECTKDDGTQNSQINFNIG